MNYIETVTNNAGIEKGSITVPFRCNCRLVGAPFIGTITVAYRPSLYMPEYNSVEAFADDLRHADMTHEEVARLTYDVCRQYLCCPLRVDVTVKSAAHPDAWVMIGDESL